MDRKCFKTKVLWTEYELKKARWLWSFDLLGPGGDVWCVKSFSITPKSQLLAAVFLLHPPSPMLDKFWSSSFCMFNFLFLILDKALVRLVKNITNNFQNLTSYGNHLLKFINSKQQLSGNYQCSLGVGNHFTVLDISVHSDISFTVPFFFFWVVLSRFFCFILFWIL